jgi:hypothetical protein
LPEKNNKNISNKISYDPKDHPFKTSWSSTSQIQEALIHHRQGHLEQAKAIYESMIQSDPNNPNAWHLLGVIAMQTKDYPQAEVFIDKALTLVPSSAEFLYNRAMLEVNQSKDLEALGYFEKSLSADAEYRSAKFQLALCLSRLNRPGDMGKAIDIITQLIKTDENFLDGYYQLGIIYRILSNYEGSIDCFQNLISKNKKIPEAHIQLGYSLKLAGKFTEAIAAYSEALQLKPDDPSILNMRGVAYYELKDFPHALADYESALKLDNTMAEIYTNMGILVFDMGQQDQALQYFNRAIQCDHEFFSAYLNLAHCYEKLNKIPAALDILNQALTNSLASPFRNNLLDAQLMHLKADLLRRCQDYIEAIDIYTQLIKITPDSEFYNSRGLCHYYLAQFDLAKKDYEQAISINKQLVSAEVNLAILELLLGNYEQGFRYYESRRYLPGFELSTYSDLGEEWVGQSLNQKNILVICEQGFGDVIFFGRYIECLLGLEANIGFIIPDELFRLYHDWLTSANISNIKNLSLIKKSVGKKLVYNYFIRLPSLPCRFLTHLGKNQNIPQLTNYLTYNKKLRSIWEMTLGIKKRPRIGLFWSGFRKNSCEERNNISLTDLLAVLPKDHDLISLQISYLNSDEEVKLMKEHGINDYHAKIHDFSDTAALIACMDFVISVDTAVAHLSACLKKSTFLLLPLVPDWRWLLEREDSPWYPNLKIFRQVKLGDWTDPLNKLAENLFK